MTATWSFYETPPTPAEIDAIDQMVRAALAKRHHAIADLLWQAIDQGKHLAVSDRPAMVGDATMWFDYFFIEPGTLPPQLPDGRTWHVYFTALHQAGHA